MVNPILRQIPVISVVSGFAGAFYWTLLPDMTNLSFGAPATKSNLMFFKDDKGLDTHTLKLSKELETKLLENGVTDSNLHDVEYFWCKKPDVVSIGCVNNLKTSFIGLPVHFIYQNIDQFKLATDTKDGQLRQSMVLSDSAKKFAMASAYYRLESIEFNAKLALLLTALGPFATIFKLQPLMKRKSQARQLSVAGAVIVAWICIFFQFSKLLKAFVIYGAERNAASLGDEYVDGGIEYFTKIINRNKTIHQLDVEKGANVVDSEGNQIYGLFEIPEPHFTKRQLKLMRMKEQSKQEK